MAAAHEVEHARRRFCLAGNNRPAGRQTMNTRSIVRVGGGGALATMAVCGLLAAPAFGAAVTTKDITGAPFDLGPSPIGLPENCPFPNGDANFVYLSGNSVVHDSSNKNGDWGGGTATGNANFYEDSTLIDTGHLTIWQGGGNNAKQQTEGGLTLTFTGSSVTIHVNGHQTTNAAGTPTANVLNIQVSCTAS
jgi:hypothetical protein